MKHPSNINIVFLTDLHIGVNRLNPQQVYEHLELYVYPKLKECDMLILGGDFFDALTNLDSSAGLIACMIMSDFRHMARVHKFFIRAIRGTFFHDRDQMRQILITTDRKNPEYINESPLVKLVDKGIEAEYIPTLGLSFLYIPDDLPDEVDIMAASTASIQQLALDKVDFIVHHGYCTHLLPTGIPTIPKHTLSYEQYRNLYKVLMLNGHIHYCNVHHTVINGGSFERFVHGDDEPKGFFVINYSVKTHQATFEFIENKHAAIFKTFTTSDEMTETEYDELRAKITACIQDVDPDINVFIRVAMTSSTYRPLLAQWMKSEHKHTHLTIKGSVVSEMAALDTVEFKHEDLPVLTPDTLTPAIINFLKQRDIEISEQDIRDVYPDLIPDS